MTGFDPEFDPRAPSKPGEYTALLDELIGAWRGWDFEFPNLKPWILSQWMLESNRGRTYLANAYRNFGGLKWRKEMRAYGRPMPYTDHAGETEDYVAFESLNNFISGFIRFIDRLPYQGWRDHAHDGAEWIAFMQASGYVANDPEYAEKVARNVAEAAQALGMAPPTGEPAHKEGPCCSTGEDDDDADDLPIPAEPEINRTVLTTQKSSRRNSRIDKIIVHYTTSRNINGSIAWFLKAPKGRRSSAHRLIGQDGEHVLMVRDEDSAWHAGKSAANRTSLGVEMSAKVGDVLTKAQEKELAALLRHWLAKYELKLSALTAHKSIKPTSCPGDIFSNYGAGIKDDGATCENAMRAFCAVHGIGDYGQPTANS